MNIRHFTDQDRPALAKLQIDSWRAAYADFVPADELGEKLATRVEARWQEISFGMNEFVLVAADHTGLTGFVTVLAQAMPFIDNFHVRPGLYRTGIGRAMMAATAHELLELEQTSVALTVLEANTRAVSFYRAVGGTSAKQFWHEFLGVEQAVHRMEWHDLSALSQL